MASSQKTTVPITITVDVPISAICAVRNATDNDRRIGAIAEVSSKTTCVVVDAIRASASRSSEDLHLMSLPREIRDYIWQHVVVLPNGYKLTKQHHRYPKLLAICKQIRAEAAQIYYGENDFNVGIINCDGAWLGDWTTTAWTMLPLTHDENSKSFKTNVRMRGDTKWQNLIQWLKVIHSGHAALPPFLDLPLESSTGGYAGRVAHRAFNILHEMLDAPGKMVVKVLEQYRKTVVNHSHCSLHSSETQHL